ncbi:MAG: type I restriction endonuclease subunit R [Coleofasciculaceae cyanobacterium SM2_1_6]|nr:type I restriction endonuclease subunit R [Coleofasciculaceae cyanobacterium SM2_1_6]
MSMSIAVTEAIRSLGDVESNFGLRRSTDNTFFEEWQRDFAPLTELEQQTLDRIRHSYLYHMSDGVVSEGMVNLLMVSPLLFLAEFLEAPFSLRSETAVEICDQDRDVVYNGRIDALVLNGNLWVVLIEAKRSSFSFLTAVPQALAYMIASPNGDKPTYALVTNGDHFMFIKLQDRVYDLSDDFSLFRRSSNELYRVLQILKSLGVGL